MIDERAALSTTILDLNDDCLYYIFMMLSIKDQLQLVNTCERFRLIVRQMIWPKQYQKIRSIDLSTDQLNNEEYQQFFHNIVEYLEEFTIVKNKHMVFSSFWNSYLGGYSNQPELTFYLCSHFPRLTRLECLDGGLHDSHMRMIVENCPQLQVLRVTNDTITGAHIKDMSNLHELYLPGCTLSSKHLSDIFMHLKITHLDVSYCNINLPIHEQTWNDLCFLKMSENQLEADFVEKYNYLRALNCLAVVIVNPKCSYFPHWTGLFESLGSIITAMNLYDLRVTYVMSAIARNTNHLTALEKMVCVVNSFSDLHDFAMLPALKEFHLHTHSAEDMDSVVSFIAQTKYLEHLEVIYWYEVFATNFDWLLDVIRILRQQKGRPKLCLNLAFDNVMYPTLCDEIKSLVMTGQNNTSQPLLEVTFNTPTVHPSVTFDRDIKLYFKRM